MATPVCTIDENGIHAPTYQACLDYFKAEYRGIYGQDVYLENDSQDGQLLALFALALHDANSMSVSVYNAFSPSSAQGVGLSRVVKINGLRRNVATSSTVDLRIVGVAGTTISNGAAADDAGNRWLLPVNVTIPPAGEITVTAIAAQPGDMKAAPDTITTIATPTRGWQSVTNPSDAVPGAPVERDAALRRRQAVSTALPSRTVLEGIVGAVASISGVNRYRVYENDTDITDVNGIPSHSIAFVVEGGDAQTIAETIARKKTPGAGTFGSTTVTVIDAYGVAHDVRFSRPVQVDISVAIVLKPLAGYTTGVEESIKQAAADYINAVEIGGGEARVVEWGEVIEAVKSIAGKDAFRLVSLELSSPGGAGTPDIALAFDEASQCDIADVTVSIAP